MLRSFLPGACVGLIVAGGFVAIAQGCSSFAATDDAADSAETEAAPVGETGAGDAFAEAAPVDAGPFCTTHADATFCADFEAPPVDTGWGAAVVTEGTFAIIDGGASPASLFAMQATTADASGPTPDAGAVPQPDGGTFSIQSATLEHNFKPALVAGVISFEADMRLDDLPPADGPQMVSAFSVEAVGDQLQHSVSLAFGRESTSGDTIGAVLAIAPGGGDASTSLSFTLPKKLHEWFHVLIEVDRSAPFVRIIIDGVEAMRMQPTTVFDGQQNFLLSAGVVTARIPSSVVIAFDNVLLKAP